MELITENVWRHIQKYSKIKSNKYVAVAYLGKGASKLLPLDSGDVLVVDASVNSIKSGRTNPYELESYLKKGVEVFSYENLHAKVFVFGHIALIGSANVSNHSENVLTECMVTVKSPKIVSEARGFIKSLAREQLSPEYVKYLITIYRPPMEQRGKEKFTDQLSETSLWIQSLRDYEFTETEQSAYEIGKKKVKKNIVDKRKYEVVGIRYQDNDKLVEKGKIGDLIIKLNNEKVYPAARILGFQKSPEDNSTIILIEESISPKILKKAKFIEKMDKLGFKQKFKKFSRQSAKNSILGLF